LPDGVRILGADSTKSSCLKSKVVHLLLDIGKICYSCYMLTYISEYDKKWFKAKMLPSVDRGISFCCSYT
jgi:hypothetical protein